MFEDFVFAALPHIRYVCFELRIISNMESEDCIVSAEFDAGVHVLASCSCPEGKLVLTATVLE